MLALIYALNEEIKPFLKKVPSESVTKIEPFTFMEGRLQAKPLLLCRCGIGMGNAHEATEILIDRFHPEFIVSAGYAGGLQEGIKTGEMILPTEVWSESNDRFQASPPLRSRLKEMILKSDLPLHEGPLLTVFNPIKSPGEKVDVGRKGAIAVDMESVAVAAVCSKKSVPFVSLRVLYDPVEMEAPEFEPMKVIQKSPLKIPKLFWMNQICRTRLAKVLELFVTRW